jgi:hypothetical protein
MLHDATLSDRNPYEGGPMPPSMRRTATAATIACVVALAGYAGTATATNTVHIHSTISISASELHFKGKVRSSNDACESGRRVVLYRTLSGGGSKPIGSTTTSPSGRWHITVSGSAGISMSKFFVKAKRRSEGTAGTIYVCDRARSQTISG